MAKVLWTTTMSLDGFIAGPGDDMRWVFEYDSNDSGSVQELIRTTGALLVGRRTHDVGRKEDQVEEAKAPFGGAWSGPIFVLTHRPPTASEDEAITYLSGDVRRAVARAREAAGSKDVLVLGADVARQCLEEGLMDEVVVHLVPVLLGAGVRLYGGPGGRRVDLERVSAVASGQVTELRFRVVKAAVAAGEG
jgi:dihydrofolate reductase